MGLALVDGLDGLLGHSGHWGQCRYAIYTKDLVGLAGLCHKLLILFGVRFDTVGKSPSFIRVVDYKLRHWTWLWLSNLIEANVQLIWSAFFHTEPMCLRIDSINSASNNRIEQNRPCLHPVSVKNRQNRRQKLRLIPSDQTFTNDIRHSASRRLTTNRKTFAMRMCLAAARG